MQAASGLCTGTAAAVATAAIVKASFGPAPQESTAAALHERVLAGLQAAGKLRGALAVAAVGYAAVNGYKLGVACYRAWLMCKIPGPRSPSLFWGQFWYLRVREPYKYQLEWSMKYGDLVCYRVMPFGYRLAVHSPEDMRRILVSHPKEYPKPTVEMQFVRALAGDGLVSAEGATHTHQRKIVAEAFHFDAVSKLYPIFVEQAEGLIRSWALKCPADPPASGDTATTVLDISQQMSFVTLDIIGLTAFGYAFDSVKGASSEVRAAHNDIMPMGGLNLTPMLLKMFPILSWMPIPAIVRSVLAQEKLRTLVRHIVDLKSSSLASDEGRSKHDLLDVMLKAGARDRGMRMSNEELANNVRTFLLAGHETTATALTWTHYLLALNPHKRRKLRNMLVEKLKGKAPSSRQLSNNELPYLAAVLKEVMRLYPPVPLTIRVTTKEDQFGGYTVPKDTILVLSPAALGRRPDLWKDPNDFIPERWLGADGVTVIPGNDKHPFAWLPFLAGERSCIGRGFAEKEYMCLLALMVQHAELNIAPECPPIRAKAAITQMPHPKLLMTCKMLNPHKTDAE